MDTQTNHSVSDETLPPGSKQVEAPISWRKIVERCHNAEPFFQQVPELTLHSSLKSLKLRLWDEDSQKLVGYKHLKTMQLEKAA